MLEFSPPQIFASESPSGGTPLPVAKGPADDVSTTRFTYLPISDEEPVLLSSHFGVFSLRLAEGTRRPAIRSRIAFGIQPCPPLPEQAGSPLLPRDFWSCRSTFAIDIRTAKPHRLIWGLDVIGRLVTFARPPLRMPDPEARQEPTLIPIDKATFERCVTAGNAAEQKVGQIDD